MNKEIIKKIIFNIFLFIFFYVILRFVYVALDFDVDYDYYFSYGLVNGFIPYKDFNIIIPLFSPFIYSIFMNINDSIITLYLEQSFILVLFYNFLFKYLGKEKGYLYLFISCLGFPIYFVSTLFPGYNSLLFILIVLIIYLEKNNKSDRIIGLLLGICLITKHTVGIFLLIPTLIIYRKDIKRIITRYLYALIPIGIFIIYLVFNNTFFDFINYCFLGLIDFGNNKTSISYFYLGICIILCIYSIYRTIRYKNKDYLYLIFYISVIVSSIEEYHCSYFILMFILIFISNSKFNIKLNSVLNIFILLLIPCFYLLLSYPYIKDLSFKKYNNFSYVLGTDSFHFNNRKILNYTKNFNRVIYVCEPVLSLSSDNFDSYLILNNGNFGYNGVEEFKKKIDKEHDVYFVFNDYRLVVDDPFLQINYELIDYIKDNSKKIDYIYGSYIYYKE